jgi:hypothetical protein
VAARHNLIICTPDSRIGSPRPIGTNLSQTVCIDAKSAQAF